MTGNTATISVVIPVRNESSKIKACLDGILKQTIQVHEIIVIDSGSTDDTVSILKTYPQVTLVEIPADTFNHGETRNLGVQKATGEFVLLTVGDARPATEYWIEEMLRCFTDPEVAGVCGQQIVPHEPDKNPVEWFRPVSEPQLTRYQFKDPASFTALSPLEKKTICSWDDVTAMYRRRVLLETPFRRTSYSEDAIWAKEAIMKGHAIVYNQKAMVYHYHLENSDFVFRRAFTTMYFRYKEFGFLYEKPVLSLRSRVSILKSLVKSLGWATLPIISWYHYNTENFKAAVKAHQLFTQHLLEGDQSLDAAHEKYCGKPPVPQK